mmetsp:Transcript_31832/g.53869  ORF Transcript_31832/g.53869 Transcript_31832/m.53869 type:complete len:104 (-) Transcript_31832:1864-2175(-)
MLRFGSKLNKCPTPNVHSAVPRCLVLRPLKTDRSGDQSCFPTKNRRIDTISPRYFKSDSTIFKYSLEKSSSIEHGTGLPPTAKTSYQSKSRVENCVVIFYQYL